MIVKTSNKSNQLEPVVPPVQWTPRSNSNEVRNVSVQEPIKDATVHGRVQGQSC